MVDRLRFDLMTTTANGLILCAGPLSDADVSTTSSDFMSIELKVCFVMFYLSSLILCSDKTPRCFLTDNGDSYKP